jgi:isoleucyl-tRNA synthetase
MTVQFSKVYLESVKDTLYCDAETSPNRREAVALLDLTFKVLLYCLYPFTPHLVHQFTKAHQLTVSKPTFPASQSSVWEEVCSLRDQVNAGTETLRQAKLLGKNTEAKVTLLKLPLSPEQTADVLGVSEANAGTALKVELHDGHKCPRCWKFHRTETELCPRCTQVEPT